MFAKPKPEEVFTPRSAEVNEEMYVPRPELELALKNALRGNVHILIHGQSGTGKSWLYKKQFGDLSVEYMVANLANASRFGTITAELKNLVEREGRPTKTGYEESKSGGLDVVVAKAEVAHTGIYELGQAEPFEACLNLLRNRAGGHTAVLVFDNLEAAFSEPLLKELADLIILCDDERYAKYKVKLMMVGVPSGVKEYYYKTPHHATVANRITELPEVSKLSRVECDILVRRGFEDKLGHKLDDPDELLSHIRWVTDRLPQIVHEYCLQAAYVAEGRDDLTMFDLVDAQAAWMQANLFHPYAVIETHMNERDTKAGRRNQTMYALSHWEGEQFKAADIEFVLRSEFPNSTSGTALNVAQTLSQLAQGDRPVIRRSPRGDAYEFVDPRYRMTMRVMLSKTDMETVEKAPISN